VKKIKKKVFEKPTEEQNSLKLSFSFFIIVGVLLSWSLVSAIISTTEFQNNHLAIFTRVLFVVVIFTIIFSHKYLLGAGVILLLSFALFTFSGFNSLRGEYSFQEFFAYGLPILPDEPSLATRFAHLLSMTFRYIIGIERHTLLFENVTIWVITLVVSLLIVIFCYFRFYFWILFAGSAVGFAVLISSPYFSHPWSFFVYIFCILALLAKLLHHRNIDGSTKATSPFSKYIMPVVAFCLMPAFVIPAPQTGFIDDGALSRSFNAINDMFYNMTQQRTFSLRQVGFSGTGGRLGGAVTLNHNLFMRIRIDDGNLNYQMPIYITGATSDTYTGYSWENVHVYFSPVDFDSIYQNMELFERATEIATVESPWLTVFVNNIAEQIPLMYYNLTDDDYIMITSEESLNAYYVAMSAAIHGEYLSDHIDGDTMIGSYLQLLEAIDSMTDQLEETGRAEVADIAYRDASFSVGAVTGDVGGVRTQLHFFGLAHGGQIVRSYTEEGIGYRMSGFVHGRANEPVDVRWSANTAFTTLEIDVLNTRPTAVFHTGIVQDVFAQNAEVAFLRDRDGRFQGASQLPRQTRYSVLYSSHNHFPSSYFDFDRDVLLLTSLPRPIFSYPGILQDNFQPFNTVISYMGHDFLTITLSINDMDVCFLELFNNYLIPRAGRIHEVYTSLPEDFPTRVAELARTVTADATNNYERMRLLEEYLSQNYSYTLSTVRPPADMDFVEHFLFETGQGYCVYFATAFVTMARSLDVPARYVEGFLVRGTPNDNGFINVYNSMGHAWPEVYFEGYGWRRFEPTPASGLPQFNPPPEGGAAQGGDIPDWANEFDNMHNGAAPTPTHPTNGGTPQAVDADTESFSISIRAFTLFSLGIILALLIARIIFLQGKMLPRRKWHPAAAIHFYRITLSYLKHFGFEIGENETVFQFADRVFEDSHLISVGNIDSDLQDLRKATLIFAKARYSNEDVSKKEVILVRKVSRSLDAKLKIKMGRWKYLLHRYIIGFGVKRPDTDPSKSKHIRLGRLHRSSS